MSPPIVFVTDPSPTTDITLQVKKTNFSDEYAVSGWEQPHLTVLVFEFEVGPAVIIDKMSKETGKKEDPLKMVEVQVTEEYSKSVIDLSNNRKGKQ